MRHKSLYINYTLINYKISEVWDWY